MVTSVPPPRRVRQVNAAQAIGLMLAFALVASVGGLLAAGLVLPAVATTSNVANTTVQIFDELPDEPLQSPLSEKSTILAADGTVLAEAKVVSTVPAPGDEAILTIELTPKVAGPIEGEIEITTATGAGRVPFAMVARAAGAAATPAGTTKSP